MKPHTLPILVVVRITGVVALLAFLSSCATVPAEVHVTRMKLASLKRSALRVTSSELIVRQASEEGFSWLPVFLFGILGGSIDAAVRFDADREQAKEVRGALGRHYFEKMLEGYFLEHIQAFSALEMRSLDRDTQTLQAEGYNVLTELNIVELSLRRSGDTSSRVYVHVEAKMTELNTGTILWKRFEMALGEERASLDAYKTEEGRSRLLGEIRRVFQKIALRLATDLAFSR